MRTTFMGKHTAMPYTAPYPYLGLQKGVGGFNYRTENTLRCPTPPYPYPRSSEGVGGWKYLRNDSKAARQTAL
ncbi:hypothetical protein CEXT_679841 [Caerostris extrusa]|uniref:Uncharacterized protein n=1 Tax=Caerostris extrusa TaxID=172846 RepID=A0AAV4PP88_CAEEX|nr:hypothetical protein CEXT_679841 [Caerostris extrusa]